MQLCKIIVCYFIYYSAFCYCIYSNVELSWRNIRHLIIQSWLKCFKFELRACNLWTMHASHETTTSGICIRTKPLGITNTCHCHRLPLHHLLTLHQDVALPPLATTSLAHIARRCGIATTSLSHTAQRCGIATTCHCLARSHCTRMWHCHHMPLHCSLTLHQDVALLPLATTLLAHTAPRCGIATTCHYITCSHCTKMWHCHLPLHCSLALRHSVTLPPLATAKISSGKLSPVSPNQVCAWFRSIPSLF